MAADMFRVMTMPPFAVLSRRAVFALAAPIAALGLASARPGLAQPANRATSLVKSTADQLIAIVNGPGSVADKKPKLRQVIEAAVDVEEIGRFALGRFWRTATAEQQKEYSTLFHDVLLNSITAKVGEYKGVTYSMGTTQTRDDGEHVATVVTRPNNPPNDVSWVVANTPGGLKIVDVIAEGTSMRLTQRSDYAAYLARNNASVAALINAMREQIARN